MFGDDLSGPAREAVNVRITPRAAAVARDLLKEWVDEHKVLPGDEKWFVMFEVMAAYHALADVAGYPNN